METERLANDQSFTAHLTSKAFDMVSVFPRSHDEFKCCDWFAALRTFTGNSKQPAGEKGINKLILACNYFSGEKKTGQYK
jgi:hypothetical protein